ncbi:VIT family protein [Nocardioides sp. SOB77]|uniref:VIT family protein n=2 Tax=Nocardioides TaxID=1839 RepID=A0ABT8FMA8_9ACTN|nr:MULTISPECIES: VIT family protein [Nocardioides]MDN4175605.1 VIT family protein [Nocardioides oceani]MDO3398086.1 VIT family protein [Nocardioides cremeus]
MVTHRETHVADRASWLRAAVLGADDGIVSTAGLMAGVAAAAGTRTTILTAGLAGLVAGAISMAAGEYVSVSSQRDAERADLNKERRELTEDPEGELLELTLIYEGRGLDRPLAEQVAQALSKHDALSAHVRDELGQGEQSAAKPVQAAIVSALAFAIGAAVPLFAVLIAPTSTRTVMLVSATLLALGVLGVVGARLGGARQSRAAMRVLAGGTAALLITAAVGKLVNTSGL